MAHETKDMPVRITHGFTETHVALVFSHPIDRVFFTPEQAEDFIAKIRGTIESVRAKQAGQPVAPAAPEAANG